MKKKCILLFLVFLLVLAIHSTYILNSFTWLDHGDIESRRAVVPLAEISVAFVTPFGHTGFYRPVVTLMHSLDYALYGTYAPGYHITNILLHSLVSVAAVLFLSVFFRLSIGEIVLIMLIVGLHPLGWLPAGSISYRPELLVTLFILLTVFFHAKTRMTGNSFYAALTISCFFIGLMSKETALILIPMVLILWEISYKDLHKIKRSSFLYQLYIPEFLLVGLYMFVRLGVVPQIWHVQQYPLNVSEAIGTRVSVISNLSFEFLNPLKPSLSDAVVVTGIEYNTVIFIIVVLLLVFFVIKKGRFSEWSKALLLFGVMVLPALAIIPVPRLGSPHYGYIPLAAFAILVILAMRSVSSKWKIASRALISIWILIMAYTTLISGVQFKNDQTLFEPEVAIDTRFYEGYFYLGNYYLTQKDFVQAEAAYTKAIQKNPTVIAYHERTAAYMNLATVKMQQNKRDEAIQLLENAMKNGNTQHKKEIEYFLKRVVY